MRLSARLVSLYRKRLAVAQAAQAAASAPITGTPRLPAQLLSRSISALPAASQASSSVQYQQQERRFWSWPAVGLGAAVAALAAQTTVLADASADKGGNKDDASTPAAVQHAQEALNEAWVEVQLDQHRRLAQLPGAAANSQPPAAVPGPAPRAQLVDGKLLLTIPVQHTADGWLLSSRLQAAVNELARGSGFTSVHSSAKVIGENMLREWKVTSQGPDGRRSSLKLQQCRNQPPAPSMLVLEKEDGAALSPQEVALVHRLVHAANEVGSPVEPLGSVRQGMREARRLLGDSLFDSLDELFRGSVLPHWPSSLGQPDGIDEFVDWLDGIYAQGKEELERIGGLPHTEGEPQEQPQQQLQRRSKGAGLQLPETLEMQGQGGPWGSPKEEAAAQQLQSLGCKVIPPGKKESVDWGVLAGYEEQKRTIEDCLLLPLQHPEVYDQIAAKTREEGGERGSSRPRAVLFEGPPGTGKTTSARVLSSQAAVPLVYVPLEAVLSKWYGESEQLISKVFKNAAGLGGCIVFIDELDALATSRDSHSMHEVTRRLLSLLLREIDGFETADKRAVVIGATNRRQDLDPALLSRFDMIITFDLPDEACRKAILRKFARQLSDDELQRLAVRTQGMSGRDLRDVCEQTERRWASKVIRKEAPADALPPHSEYVAAARERSAAREQDEGYTRTRLHDFNTRASL